jgi:hypothetical protein
MGEFDDFGAGEFSYVFENEDDFLDQADDLLFDEYYTGEEEDPVINESEEDVNGLDAVSLGMGLSLGAELAAEEKQRAELLRRLHEIKVPVDVDEHTDEENMRKAQKMTSLQSRGKTKRHLSEFERFLDDIYSGRKSLWDD